MYIIYTPELEMEGEGAIFRVFSNSKKTKCWQQKWEKWMNSRNNNEVEIWGLSEEWHMRIRRHKELSVVTRYIAWHFGRRSCCSPTYGAKENEVALFVNRNRRWGTLFCIYEFETLVSYPTVSINLAFGFMDRYFRKYISDIDKYWGFIRIKIVIKAR